MINELVIHLGDTKTGSTSIQRALVHKAYKVPGLSIAYPTINNHIGLAKTLSEKRRFDQRGARFNRIYKVFLESDADYGIVSAEHFQFVEPEVLHQAIADYWPALADRLRLVAYVRPHCDKMLSAFSERMKQGGKQESVAGIFEAMSESGYLDYTARFGAWRKVFGDRFELRPFVRDQLFQGDVVHDFCKFVFRSEDFEIMDLVSANTSLTVSQLALLREVHKQLVKKLHSKKGPRFKDAAGMLGRIVADSMQARELGKDSDKLRMPTSLVDRFTERYLSDAAALDAAFFDGGPMEDALRKIHLKATSTVQSLDAEDYFSLDIINSVHVFADVLASLLIERPALFTQAVSDIRAKTNIFA